MKPICKQFVGTAQTKKKKRKEKRRKEKEQGGKTKI